MKQLFIIIISLCSFSLLGQNGGVTVSSSTSTDDGTIRYESGDFEGLKAGTWTSLTGTGGGSSLWSSNGNEAYYNLGNVGIGNTNPSFRLDVEGGSMRLKNSVPFFTFEAGASNNSGIIFKQGTLSRSWVYRRAAQNALVLSNSSSGATPSMVLTDGGFVGIGTFTPSKNLDLAANGADIRFSNSNFSAIQWYEGTSEVAYLSHNGDELILQNRDAGDLEIEAETGAINIKTTNRVNFGEDPVDPIVEIFDNNTGALNHGSIDLNNYNFTGTNKRAITFGTNGSNNEPFIQMFKKDGVTIGINLDADASGQSRITTDEVFVDNINRTGGQVVIGDSDAATGYLLSVNGKIISEEVRVQDFASWPDYVFAEDYNLRSIEELENSIKENNHLPGIPSAAEVMEEGILLGDMQKRMLEKIEELTLYIIDQDKRIKNLETELQKK